MQAGVTQVEMRRFWETGVVALNLTERVAAMGLVVFECELWRERGESNRLGFRAGAAYLLEPSEWKLEGERSMCLRLKR